MFTSMMINSGSGSSAGVDVPWLWPETKDGSASCAGHPSGVVT